MAATYVPLEMRESNKEKAKVSIVAFKFENKKKLYTIGKIYTQELWVWPPAQYFTDFDFINAFKPFEYFVGIFISNMPHFRTNGSLYYVNRALYIFKILEG